MSGAVSNRAWPGSHCACLIFTRTMTFEWINIIQNHNECLHQQPLERRALENPPPKPSHMAFRWPVYLSLSVWRSRVTSGSVAVYWGASRIIRKYGGAQQKVETQTCLSWTQLLPPSGQVRQLLKDNTGQKMGTYCKNSANEEVW